LTAPVSTLCAVMIAPSGLPMSSAVTAGDAAFAVSQLGDFDFDK
jgi:hypothetical protein